MNIDRQKFSEELALREVIQKAIKVVKWVNKELKKWAKKDSDAIDTIEGRKKKIQSLTKKGIKKFK